MQKVCFTRLFFFHRGMKTLDASLQGLSLACFLVDCAGFTDLKTEQLFYKPMTTVAGLDGLVETSLDLKKILIS